MVIRSLDRKLLRDLWHMKTQALAIALVMACGLGTFVMSLCTSSSLERTLANYYHDQQFAEVFISLKRAPRSLVARLAEIEGVAAIEARISAEVILDIPGMAETASGKLLSLPENGEPLLNRLHLRSGRLPAPDRRHEVVLNEAFAVAQNFAPGDRLAAIINGRRQELTVAGVALSPEFVYQIRPGDVFPDDKRYGVIWMREEALAAAMNLTGAFNNASAMLTPQASLSSVLQEIDALTKRYGGQGAYGRHDQVSHRFVSDEMTQLRVMATVPPAIFLGVSAFLLNVVLSRIVRTEREQIAALKALGYSNREVGRVYLKLAMVIIGLGIAVGLGLGMWLGRGLTAMYVRFFRFPTLEFHLNGWVILAGGGISILAGLLGVAGSVRRAMKLPPAEAMRPEPPAQFRPTFVERSGLQRFLPHGARMILRQIERQPVRALLSTAGIALAISVMVLGSFSKDMVDRLSEVQFFLTQRQDAIFTFTEPSSAKIEHAVRNLPGVRKVEGFRAAPVRLRYGHETRRLAVQGLTDGAELYRLIDLHYREASLPPDGLVISSKMAETMGIVPGAVVTLEILEGSRRTCEVAIAGTIEDFSGESAFMRLDALQRLLREGETLSGVHVTFDPQARAELFAEIKKTPHVAASALKRAALDVFNELMSENMLRMRLINIAFASVIAFGVVYNAARISLSERSRELATLRVLGFTQGEVGRILLGELAVLTVLAIPAGLVFGWGFAWLAAQSMETRSQRFPFVIEPATYGRAVIVVVIAAILSSLVVWRRIRHLDLVAVLKSRE